ncbi:MAG: FAD:protein FMN transferase [Planctomycetes bacterium]|nr:FAD:protein FMN transferase [Planctomycetota bacterium]
MTEPPQSNRREFLTGRAGARVVRQTLDQMIERANESLDGVLDDTGAGDPYLVKLGRRAMACEFELYLNAGQYPQGVEAGINALDLVEQLEAQLTVYRETSEIMHLNRTAHDAPQEVEPQLFALLERAVELWRETGGAYDITAGPLSRVWGFSRRAGAIPEPSALAEALAPVGSQHLELNRETRTLRMNVPRMEINLGSIGKGYALDRSAQWLTAADVNDFLWHGGQSSVLARGCGASSAALGGWLVGLQHPVGPKRRLAEVVLRNRALATSGASVQYFRYQGRRYGHILDPRTGWPAEQVFSATVVAPTAAEADALSTAFYVLGVDAASDYCDRHPEVGALFVYPSPSGSKTELAIIGLEPDEYRLCI